MSGINVSIELDEKKLKEAHKQLSGFTDKKKFNAAMARAANKAARDTVKKAAAQAGKNYALSEKALIRQAIDIKQQATSSSLVAIAGAKNGGIKLIKYKVKGVGSVSATVKKGGGGSISNAFKATMKSGHVGIFERHKTKKMKKKKRPQIFELFGADVPDMMNNEQTIKSIQEEGRVRLDKAIDNAIRGLMYKK